MMTILAEALGAVLVIGAIGGVSGFICYILKKESKKS